MLVGLAEVGLVAVVGVALAKPTVVALVATAVEAAGSVMGDAGILMTELKAKIALAVTVDDPVWVAILGIFTDIHSTRFFCKTYTSFIRVVPWTSLT